MRKRDLKVGDHIEHVPSGDYLGVVTYLGASLVHFEGGTRTRDGFPVKVAGYTEIRKCAERVAAAASPEETT